MLALIEPIAVPDVYVSGLSHIENVGGGCWRLTCYTNQISVVDGRCERIVSLRCVVPGEAIAPAMLKVSHAVGIRMIALVR